MSDEIKEILEALDSVACCPYHDDMCKKAKKYITNLQEENEDLKDRLKVMEHFKNSLLEENERLKKENIKLYKKDTKIINELKEELEITQEKWNKDKQWSECRTKEWLDYKSRCEKAINICNYLLNNEKIIINGKEYIKQPADDYITQYIKEALNGGDEDEENQKRN